MQTKEGRKSEQRKVSVRELAVSAERTLGRAKVLRYCCMLHKPLKSRYKKVKILMVCLTVSVTELCNTAWQ